MNIFCYGTLMLDRIWSRVVKGSYKKQDGTIYGYRRLFIRNEIYPCLVKRTHEHFVRGVVYFNIDQEDCRILDVFEGECYERIKERCEIEDGKSVEVEVYALKEKYQSMADEKEWDFGWFKKNGFNSFITKYEGFLRMKLR
ncbi:gamma-glutamylcyclotransferase [candidate division KSB1 bacterium]|nr:gamma-glutamylcyclotransferase [candidate division KSB1 bacterium]